MFLKEYGFNKKCDFDMCQNTANFVLNIGAKGDLIMCGDCLEKLKKIIKLKNGETNGKTK